MLNATATAYVFKFSGRNPKIIVRWPCQITDDTPDKTGAPGQASQQRLNSKVRACPVDLGRRERRQCSKHRRSRMKIHGIRPWERRAGSLGIERRDAEQRRFLWPTPGT
jgi:hypothetical protein